MPEDIRQMVSIVSLNSPIHSLTTQSGRQIARGYKEMASYVEAATAAYNISVTPGNEEAILKLTAICADGSVNGDDVPCSSSGTAVSTVSVSVIPQNSKYSTLSRTIDVSTMVCYNSVSGALCGGSSENCVCYGKVAPVPKYTTYYCEVEATFDDTTTKSWGVSYNFTLTDVATPEFLSDLYDIPYGLNVRHGSTQAVAEWYNESWNPTDLYDFLKLVGLKPQHISVDNVYGNNPPSQYLAGGEAQLDVEYIMALAPDAETSFYSIGDYNPYSPENENFLTWMYIVGNQTNPPYVHSLSYGDIESVVFDTSNENAMAFAEEMDYQFLLMANRGLSVLVASGDDGSSSMNVRDDPSSCNSAVPEWPASSPYVTTVGATQLSNEYNPVCGHGYDGMPLDLPFQCSGVSEIVCSASTGGVITTGGGFSNVYDRETYAPWQTDFVDAYLNVSGATPSSPGFFNKTGRAYPDVAAYGSNYFVYLQGITTRESGTSASTPVFAAMVTLWNDMRFSQNKAALGFLNPWLYSIAEEYPETFYDVSVGNIACAAGHGDVTCCDETFYAAAGWDATTGLGTPHFDTIASLVLNDGEAYPTVASAGEKGERGEEGEEGDDANSTVLWIGFGLAVAAIVGVGFLFSRGGQKNDESYHSMGN
jgi:subtilase family serine protease